MSGSKHIEFLLEKKLINVQSSEILNQLYSTRLPNFQKASITDQIIKESTPDGLETETMVLSKIDGKQIAEALKIPELEVELERAVWQVEKALKAEQELKDEKKKLNSVEAEAKKKD